MSDIRPELDALIERINRAEDEQRKNREAVLALKSRLAAEQKAENERTIKALADAADFEADWKDRGQEKYFPVLNHDTGEIFFDYYTFTQRWPHAHFRSVAEGQAAEKAIGVDKIKALFTGGRVMRKSCAEDERLCHICDAQIGPNTTVCHICGCDLKEDNGLHLDIDASNWSSIKEAAVRSKWIPPQYCTNDWVSDVCDFLRGGDTQDLEKMRNEPTRDMIRAGINAYEDACGERLPDADGKDEEIICAVYKAIIEARRKGE